MSLAVLLWRGWTPPFSEGVRYSHVPRAGFGGTELQLLWHAAHLVALGHRVQVLGASRASFIERDVEFVGCADRDAQMLAMSTGQVRRPDIVLLEGAYHAAPVFRELYPACRIMHIGQNIDAGGARGAFREHANIDAYAFVGAGHLAQYSVWQPRLRPKFLLVRNAIPWREFHSRIGAVTPQEKVVWVGSWGKRGLRLWLEVMAQQMRCRKDLLLTLCGPMYGDGANSIPFHLLRGLNLPMQRVRLVSLGLPDLLTEIASARAVIVSLGNECGPTSVLDAHAMARPVVSGNDVIYSYSNPRGTGFRVSSRAQAVDALNHLLDCPADGDRLGAMGRDFVVREYHEDLQREDLRWAIEALSIRGDADRVSVYRAPGALEQAGRVVHERLMRLCRRMAPRDWPC